MANWIKTLDIKESWKKAQNDEISLAELAKEITKKLKAFGYQEDYELQEIIESFEGIDENSNSEEFDAIMDQLYDWADIPLDNEWNGRKNCWIKTF